jgi:hypothetical protein
MREHLESEGILYSEGLSSEDKARRDRLIAGWRDSQRRAAAGEFNKR